MPFQPAHKDTTTPPGQIVNPINLEKPLQEHIKDYQATEIEQLRARVLQLEQQRDAYKNAYEFWSAAAIGAGWTGDIYIYKIYIYIYILNNYI